MTVKKILLIFISVSCISCIVSAQYKEASATEKDEIIRGIMQSSADMQTMKCDFVQTKELSFMNDNAVSEGKMLYKQTNKIRWEYLKPYKYVFSMDGQTVNVSSGDKTSKIPVKTNRIFGEISNVMIGGVSGAGLINSKDFASKFMVGATDYEIILTPLKKEIKNLFSTIQLFVDKSNNRIKSVVMIEKSGDKTTIELKNVQINISINDEIFNK